MTEQSIQLKKAIMRRVYVVYFLRQLISPVALRLYALVLLVVGLASTVSVRDVLANIPEESMFALYNFSMYAVMNTDHVVQLMLFGVFGFLLWLLRDAARGAFHIALAQRAA